MRFKVRTAVIASIFMVGIGIGLAMQVSAWAVSYGYFTGRDITSGALKSYVNCGQGPKRWHSVWCGGIADYSGDKPGFIAAVKDKLDYGDSQERIGAAFIIYTMLGYSSGGSLPISSSVMTEWENRINNPDITIGNTPNFSAYPDSAYVVYNSDGAEDVSYIDMTSAPDDTLVFKYKGSPVYYIKRGCANPIGDMPGLIEVNYWDASGEAFVNGAHDVSAYPGDVVHFTYTISDVGTAPIPNVWWSTNGGSSGNVSVPVGGTSSLLPNAVGEALTVPVVAPGTKVCRHISFPDSELDSSTENSNNACVKVLSNYDLYPGITTPGVTYSPMPLMPGSTKQLTAVVQNEGTNADRDSHYEVQQFVVPSGVAAKPNFGATFTSVQGPYLYTTADHADGGACSGWLKGKFGAASVTACLPIEQGTTQFPAELKTLSTSDINADSYNAGDWVCRFMSVSIYKYNVAPASISHRISHPVCVVIAKQPSVQVWGGDVRVGDNPSGSLLSDKASVITSKFTANNATYGSWVEYGIFAPAPDGIIQSISGGAISGTSGFTPGLIAGTPANELSFANTTMSGDYGKWAPPRQIAAVESFASQYDSHNYNNAVLDVATDTGVNNGEIKRVALTGASVAVHGDFGVQGAAIVTSNGTVIIDGNINVTQHTVGSIGTAAQLVIIADKIIINSNVTHIDAWLVARPHDPAETLAGPNGVISTCDSIQAAGDYINGLKLGVCDKQLVINGALIAKEVQLRRTYGADKTTLSQPAETINLRADAYMWARPASASGSVPIKTTSTIELPPRF